ncbi:hypothetical protein [Haloarcula brevis]|uniref:hypothetical protein n=1 Tax=Haloarcula brevis TaxID=3111453 RepID=UPI00300F5D2C
MTDEKSEFELSCFLEEQSKLFTLLGVFGGVSLYLAQFPVEANDRWLNVGIVSSLIIFILAAFSIRHRLREEFDSSLFDFIIKPRRESFRVLTFVVPFYLLIISVLSVVFQYPAAGSLIGQAFLVFVGISTVLWTIVTGESLVGFDDNLGEVGRDESVVRFAQYILVLSLFGVTFAILGIFHTGNKYGYGFEKLRQFRPGPGFVPFITSYLAGILLGSLLYVVLSVFLFLLHLIVQYIDRMENKEQFLQAYQVMFGEEQRIEQTKLNEFEDE